MPSDNTVEEFLKRIAKIESGDRYDPIPPHKTMQEGLHKGMSAVGKYGFMPLTIADLVAQRRQEAQAEGSTIAPQDLSLPLPIPDSLPHTSQEYRDKAEVMGSQLSTSPEGQEVLAKYLAQKLLERTGGDQERAAYMWNMGHNRDPDKISPKTLDAKDYVQKFRILHKLAEPDVPQLEEASRRYRFKSVKPRPKP